MTARRSRPRDRLTPRSLAAGGLALVACAALPACGDGELAPRRPLTTQSEAGERLPDQIIEDGTHIVTRDGVKRAVMVARRIAFFNLAGKVEADTMEVTFYDDRGVEESRLKALFGEIDQRTNDMVARGKVLILAEDGTRIDGEELRYDSARDLVLSDKPVTILQDGNRIRGSRVETDPGLTNLRITGSSAVLREAPRAASRGSRVGRPGPAPTPNPPSSAPDPTPPAPDAPPARNDSGG